ncbi:hypothetical protein F5Y17DRAFT_466837 [Xylariaceae sp. FL0594]|nr:hypothetical protein F5Y17DRAFT_466837 [Xylariaceae sp. FL0594]
MDLLESVFNHLVLPPEIPGAQEGDQESIARHILERLVRAITTLQNITEESPWRDACQALQRSFETCIDLNNGPLDRCRLLKQLQSLSPGQVLILYVREQNAGLLIRRDVLQDHEVEEDQVIFESFEASAVASEVLRAGHALSWEFPSRSARLPYEDYAESSFLDSLSVFIEQATMEAIWNFQASTTKAGVSVGEIRDTTDPALISQMLISLLEAKGSTYQSPILHKRIRDDVNFSESNLPWRRLPFWLVLRVAAQRQLCHLLGHELGQVAYKCLMASVLSDLLDEVVRRTSPHRIAVLRTKLARRMAKLEMDTEKIRLRQDMACHNWLTAMSSLVSASLANANAVMAAHWDVLRKRLTRQIRPLPLQAPAGSLRLTLPNSGRYLDGILSSRPTKDPECGPVSLPSPLDQSIQQSQAFTHQAFSLAALEWEVAQSDFTRQLSTGKLAENVCLDVKSRIGHVFRTAGPTYHASPEEQSAMILCIFTLWVELDRAVLEKCPLLAEYAPVFRPELLDVLQLPTRAEMGQLQHVQEHLKERHAQSTCGTILDISSPDSFTVKFLRSTLSLRNLEDKIEKKSEKAYLRKQKEHRDMCESYDEHTLGIARNGCRCFWEDGERVVNGCAKCFHHRARSRMSITVHEAFLPEEDPARSSILFELAVPDWFAAYRDATWQIFSCLAHPFRPEPVQKPEVHLQSCGPLKTFVEAEIGRLSLASSVKGFQQTHYKFRHGKVPLSQIILPFAARFRLYDAELEVWVDELTNAPTLEHLCGVEIPRSLGAVLPEKGSVHPPVMVDGPSSYEIQANQALAPKDMSPQAFSALQKILSGGRRRWLNLLVEMRSSNLNLSNEGTVHAICQLAVQAGPGLPGEPLRVSHEIAKHEVFRRRLLETLDNLLDSIRANWREHNTMQLIVVLALRLNSLYPSPGCNNTLVMARKCLMQWIVELRDKTHEAGDAAEAQRLATYGLYAALLCRQTFAVLVGSADHFSEDELVTFIRATVALQENMLLDKSKLSHVLRNSLYRDAKMMYHLCDQVQSAMRAYRPTVATEITRSLTWDLTSAETGYTTWSFLPQPHEHWIVATTPEPHKQRIHFNFVEGHLLVNGKPRSKLPLDVAADDNVKFLFGDQHLRTFASNLPGMSHRLDRRIEDQEIHFGLRDGRAIVRAVRYKKLRKKETLEFIPPKLFTGDRSFDLPGELVEHCGHWLNLTTCNLEIRRASPSTPGFWRTRQRDWLVNIPIRCASRGEYGSKLVDPGSQIFQQIAEIFHDFESPQRLTVFQPPKENSRLTVELKHLDLHFTVNSKQLLQCRQLEAEIDPDQDAGTWYGLSSKIVMRNVVTLERSVIVPLGKPMSTRAGAHVEVRITSSGDYGRYRIDDVLGRLCCSPEPRLVYTKALYHALTSFCLPDPLTGRTGSSEAVRILSSGAARPWTAISEHPNTVLKYFDGLIPRREYYPPGAQRLQRVVWNPKLTPWMQCDGYLSLTAAIRSSSNDLRVFAAGPALDVPDVGHLSRRGMAQRCTYDPLLGVQTELDDMVYTPRDRRPSEQAAKVYEIARVILSRCTLFNMKSSLTSALGSSKLIGGFASDDNEASSICVMPLVSQIDDPVAENWGQLVNFCRHNSNVSGLLFRLALLAFSKSADMDIIQSLAAIGLKDEVKQLTPPQNEMFVDFGSRALPPIEVLEGFISSAYPRFQSERSKRGTQLRVDSNGRDSPAHILLCQQEGARLAGTIQGLWPMPAGNVEEQLQQLNSTEQPGVQRFELLDVMSAWETVRPDWERRQANIDLDAYLTQLDTIFSYYNNPVVIMRPAAGKSQTAEFGSTERYQFVSAVIHGWVAKPGPEIKRMEQHYAISRKEKSQSLSRAPEFEELDVILQRFEQASNALRQQYAGELRQSLTALRSAVQQEQSVSEHEMPGIEDVDIAVSQARRHVNEVRRSILEAFAAGDGRYCWLEAGAIQPVTSATDLLQLLRSTASLPFNRSMKEAVVYYGVATTVLQRLIRTRRALWHKLKGAKDLRALHDELSSIGHENWSPEDIPDWLLLEIDSDMLIRAEQVAVARAMIDSTSGNKVLQLNMGKGKTSCIIPMVEAVLASGERLSRVIVPKALLMQTAQTIQARLGGLVGRHVIHTPFSRRTSTKEETLCLYEKLHREIMHRRGIVLTSPESLLSYKLCGWQSLADGMLSTAGRMIGFQKWMEAHCRDVLDECDHTLSVKTQLNYPSGSVLPVDFYPYRWKIVQELLDLVTGHFMKLRRDHPRGLQLALRGESFPGVSFLKTGTEDSLHGLIMEDIFSGRLTHLRPVYPVQHQQRLLIQAVFCDIKLSDKSLKRAANIFANPTIARDVLLLIRGLLLHRILVLCLGKRWNVHYGLHPTRAPVAVPYEAKGKPSEEAEYGHPDVAIILTCLSFYYAGLTVEQFVEGLDHILHHSEDPAAQYEQWISTCSTLPDSLRHWNVVNTDDKGQVEQLWQILRLNRVVVNHYLNTFVFPTHARQFEVKLQACSWDIPLFSDDRAQTGGTTGFSGTNDNRLVLPLTIRQRDLPELQHTSAEVLTYLLQERNRQFHVTADSQGRRWAERELLQNLTDKGICVLIDVGAYITEMENKDVARAWLEVDTRAKAAVYFGNDNRAWVHYRSLAKVDIPLLATPFADDLSECVIFLDEAHTRGVDLKLPEMAHGAVTLALKLTKDYAVQAAMRLRRLRTSQTIAFFGPPDVDQSIRDFCQSEPGERIDSSHVVSWLLEQTCRSVEDLRGLYVAQGIDFCQRTDTVWHCQDVVGDVAERQRVLQVLRQPERQTINQLYGPTPEASLTDLNLPVSSSLRSFVDKLLQSHKALPDRILTGVMEEVEQEREVEVQVEQIRQLERPKKFSAMEFPGVHPDIARFAVTGTLMNEGQSFEQAFSYVSETNIGKRFGVRPTRTNLFVSREFTKTIRISKRSMKSNDSDNFLRPVEFIVWAPKTETALVVIPEEAEFFMKHLFDETRIGHRKSAVHLITYAAPVTKAMLCFNSLEFYTFPELPAGHTVPEHIRIELGILAGRLYVDRSEWGAVTAYVRGEDGKGNKGSYGKIADDPAAFLLEWLSMRRGAIDVVHTPMGRICTGRDMEPTDSSRDEVDSV